MKKLLKTFTARNKTFGTDGWQGLWIEVADTDPRGGTWAEGRNFSQVEGTCDIQGEGNVRKRARDLALSA